MNYFLHAPSVGDILIMARSYGWPAIQLGPRTFGSLQFKGISIPGGETAWSQIIGGMTTNERGAFLEAWQDSDQPNVDGAISADDRRGHPCGDGLEDNQPTDFHPLHDEGNEERQAPPEDIGRLARYPQVKATREQLQIIQSLFDYAKNQFGLALPTKPPIVKFRAAPTTVPRGLFRFGKGAGAPEIFLRADLEGIELGHVFLHELGHVSDVHTGAWDRAPDTATRDDRADLCALRVMRRFEEDGLSPWFFPR